MAIDWNKEISFSGLTKKKKQDTGFPEKTYMNLAIRDQSELEVRRVVPVAIVLLIVIVLFAKFGVFDFIDRVNQKEAELNTQKQALAEIQSKLTKYDSVLEEFESYEASAIGYGGEIVSPLEALTLIDRYIAPVANVSQVNIAGNTVSLDLSNISLNGVGRLVNTLYEQPIVADVSVSTATTKQAATDDVTTSLVITLQVA